jgi:hypothetical protein
MNRHVLAGAPPIAPLVVAMHDCAHSVGEDAKTGWNERTNQGRDSRRQFFRPVGARRPAHHTSPFCRRRPTAPQRPAVAIVKALGALLGLRLDDLTVA